MEVKGGGIFNLQNASTKTVEILDFESQGENNL